MSLKETIGGALILACIAVVSFLAIWGPPTQGKTTGFVSPVEQTAGMPRYTATTMSFNFSSGLQIECGILLLDKGDDRAKLVHCEQVVR